MSKISYAGYRFPPEIIQQASWLYLRFTLSFRDVEDLLAERGIFVSWASGRAPPFINERSQPNPMNCSNVKGRLPHNDSATRGDDTAADDRGSARPRAPSAINAAGANDRTRLFDRGHNASHDDEGGDGG